MVDYQFKILIDGDCPICRREACFLRWLDGGKGRLAIEDITAPDFDSAHYATTMDALMGQIHGVTPRGTLVKGMAVFRRAYDAVGLGWLTAPTNWPILRPLADRCYAIFARNRHRFTRRANPCPSKRCTTP